MARLTDSAQRRRAQKSVLWLEAVHASVPPYVVPVWFTHVAGRLFPSTECTTVEVRNVESHPRVAVSLERGDRGFMDPGTAGIVARLWLAEVVESFRRMYDWDTGDGSSSPWLLTIEPSCWWEC